MVVHCLAVGELQANCYVVVCEETHEAIVIDPGAEPSRIVGFLSKHEITPRLVVNTHGHFDHIGANAALKEHYGVEVVIHGCDATMLTDPSENLSDWIPGGAPVLSPSPDRLVDTGDVVAVGTTQLHVIHTPGHSRGSICLLGPGVLFSGDTLFMCGVGRTDLPGGDEDLLYESLRSKLFVLPDDVLVYPGHGQQTTVGHERRSRIV